MSFETDLKTHLQGGASVSALVADRIFPQVVEQGAAMPAVTYTLVFGAPISSLDGFTSTIAQYAVQLDCWAKTHDAAAALALAVRDRMNTAASSFSAVITQDPLIQDYEPDTKRYRHALQVSCHHKE